MPEEQFTIQYHVTRDQMCELAPIAVEELMRRFVRECSPAWETVRMEVNAGSTLNTWRFHLSGQGIRRGDRG